MLYLIKSSKYLKIGYTKNINNRLAAYNTCNPDYELLDVVEGTEQDEQDFHKIISEYKYKGEWFYFNQEILNIWNKKYNKQIIYNLDKELSELEFKNAELDYREQALYYRENFILNNLKNLLDQKQSINNYLEEELEKNSMNYYIQLIKTKDEMILQLSNLIKDFAELNNLKINLDNLKIL